MTIRSRPRTVRLGLSVLLLVPWLLLLAGPVLGAGETITVGKGVLIRVDGDLVIEAGETAQAAIAISGNVTVRGTVQTVFVTGGTATIESGGQVESVVVINGSAVIGAGAIVYGDVRVVGGEVTKDPAADIRGSIRGVDADLVGVQAALAIIFSIVYVGISILMIVGGVLLAGIASRQVRAAGQALTGAIPSVLGAGAATWIGLPVLAALLMVTVVGIPVGLALLIVILPALWVLGYLTSGILVGEWLLTRVFNRAPADRPFLGAFIGVLLLQVLGFVPPFGFVAGLAGSSALALLAWRSLRGRSISAPAAPGPTPVAGGAGPGSSGGTSGTIASTGV